MSSSPTSSAVCHSVVVSKNPIPAGTTFTVLLPWVEASTKEYFLSKIFNQLDWGRILGINMIFKKATQPPPRGPDGQEPKGGVKPKRAHYKVFIHFGDRNPDHAPVFEYLDVEKNELKVWYNDRFYWKVRQSSWKPDPRNDIRVDFGTSPSAAVPKATTPPLTSPPASP
jgi:hypothetical protein